MQFPPHHGCGLVLLLGSRSMIVQPAVPCARGSAMRWSCHTGMWQVEIPYRCVCTVPMPHMGLGLLRTRAPELLQAVHGRWLPAASASQGPWSPYSLCPHPVFMPEAWIYEGNAVVKQLEWVRLMASTGCHLWG